MKQISASDKNYSLTSQIHDWISSPLGIAVMCGFMVFLAYKKIRSQQYPTYDDDDYENDAEVPMREPMKNLRLTKKQLLEYNSTNRDGKLLIALLGTIFDVSMAPQDFGPRGTFRYLTGTDIMGWLQSKAQSEKVALSTVLDEWQAVLEDHFFVAGALIPDENDNANNNNKESGESDDSSTYKSALDDNEYMERQNEFIFPEDTRILNSSIYNTEDGDKTLLAPTDVDQTLTNWNEGDQTIIQAEK